MADESDTWVIVDEDDECPSPPICNGQKREIKHAYNSYGPSESDYKTAIRSTSAKIRR